MRLLTAWIVIVCWSETMALAAWWFHFYGLSVVFMFYPLFISALVKEERVRRKVE